MLSCSKIYKGKKYIKDLTGQRFDKLLVLELLPERKHDHTIYKCLCDCGKITNVARGSLVRGLTHSCGQCYKKISRGEEKIQKILNQLNIKYQTQYKFQNCKDKRILSFDFYLPDYNCCIEYDGIQHFEPGHFSEPYENIQRRDSIKNNYCKNNNIKLIRIPYYDFDNINIEYLQNKLQRDKRR